MSKLLKVLVAEHDRILAVMVAFTDFAAMHAQEDPEARPTLARFVQFLREYVDGWHHAKEEDLLFEVMVRGGFPRDTGPIGCMLREHDLGRGHVRALGALAKGEDPFNPTELALLAELVVGHARVLVPHIGKENQVLYPMAARLLSPEAVEALDEAGAILETRRSVWTCDLEALGDDLVARYGAARVGARVPG